jgi:hypothetical protein
MRSAKRAERVGPAGSPPAHGPQLRLPMGADAVASARTMLPAASAQSLSVRRRAFGLLAAGATVPSTVAVVLARRTAAENFPLLPGDGRPFARPAA